jgi:hypothetical protein
MRKKMCVGVSEWKMGVGVRDWRSTVVGLRLLALGRCKASVNHPA